MCAKSGKHQVSAELNVIPLNGQIIQGMPMKIHTRADQFGKRKFSADFRKLGDKRKFLAQVGGVGG